MSARDGGGRRGCLRTTALSCGGCAVVVLGVAFVLAAIGLSMGIPDPEQKRRDLSRQLPTVSPTPGDASDALHPSEIEALSGVAPPAGEFTAGRPGRVILDLSMGDFVIEPGPPGEPARVEADFDSASYRLVESLEERDSEWVYRVEFGSSISWVRRMFGVNASNNNVKIILPKGTPFVLEGEIGMGQSKLQLGGLWLNDVDLSMGVGDHTVRFDEPTPRPLGRFRIDGSTGELDVHGLGNASPAEVWINQNIGQLSVDLKGAWRGDSDVKVGLRIGELGVRVPQEGVKVDLARSSVTIGERRMRLPDPSAAPGGAPTLRLTVNGFIGESSIR